MKLVKLLKSVTLFVSFFVVLLLTPEVMHSQTAGGSVVLANCNSSIQFSIQEPLGAEAVILNICKIKTDKSRIDYYINGIFMESLQISYKDSIRKGGFSAGQIIKIVNIEKGIGGTQCNKRGPGDSDIRVRIPSNAYNIVATGLPGSATCGNKNCKANLAPIKE